MPQFNVITGDLDSPGGLRPLVELGQPVLDALPIGVYVCAADGAILRFNRKAAELWAREPQVLDTDERFCGSYRLYDTHGEPVARDATPMARSIRDGASFQDVEMLIENLDGRRWTASITVEPIRNSAGELVGAINCFQDVTQRKRDQDALRESERRHRELLQALPAAIYTTDAEGRITFYNKAAVEFSGREPEIGADSWCVSWRLYWPDGTPLPHDQCPMAMALREKRAIHGEYEAIAERPDGVRRPFIPFATPLFDSDGQMIGGVNMLVDISERQRANERQKVLIDELNHRVKNTLATVQSIAVQTIAEAASLQDFRTSYEGRLVTLSRAHDLLTSTQWEGAALEDVMRQELDAFGPGRFTIEGPDVQLSARAALSLSMIVHELATNAAKYGALSGVGRIDVTWSREGGPEGAVRLEWVESGGPPVEAPMRRGFGTRLIERAASRELAGSVDLEFPAEGLRCTLRIPGADNLRPNT